MWRNALEEVLAMKVAVLGSFLIAILHSILFFDQKLGISVFLFCIALGFFFIYILDKNGKIKKQKGINFMYTNIVNICNIFYL